MAEYSWSPSKTQIEEANVTRLMRGAGFEVDSGDVEKTRSMAQAFVRKSQRDIVWFWERALADMGMEWDVPYHDVLDLEDGPENC